MKTRITGIILLAVAIALCVTLALANVIRDNSFQAASDGVNVTLHWITDDETSVSGFEVQRSDGSSNTYETIATVTPKGPSLYEYVDNTAFRKTATVYDYRIKIDFSNGQPSSFAGPVVVVHSVSGVRRTWGSIKAMFR